MQHSFDPIQDYKPLSMFSQVEKPNTNPMSTSSASQFDWKTFGVNMGTNATDTILTMANTAIYYNYVMADDGKPKTTKLPFVNYSLPTWVIYSVASGISPLLTGIITRTVVPSFVKLSPQQAQSLLLFPPLVNFGVGMLVSYSALWLEDPLMQASITQKGYLVDKKKWMGIVNDGLVFSGAALLAELESSTIFSMVK
jgi:hypothetical protein